MSDTTILMYDLAGRSDDLRISPFCWRIRMALAHKRVEVRTLPWRMIEKDKIVNSGSMTVPVIVDGSTIVSDSWDIAEYLDRVYPQRPLFESPQARAYCLWIHHWAERVLHRLIVPIILKNVLDVLHPKDMDYFRRTREAAFRKPLEEVFDRSPAAFERLKAALGPVRGALREQPFLAGHEPGFGDYIVFGAFQWARCCSNVPLLNDADDPMASWFARLLDLYGGVARSAATPTDELCTSTGTDAK